MHSKKADERDRAEQRHLRRVLIEDAQQQTIDHARTASGYAADVDPHAHDAPTFRLINQRKKLDALPGSEIVVPGLDDWKHWTKMDDWDSRNRMLEQLCERFRRRDASSGELQLLITVTRPAWLAVSKALYRFDGLQVADDWGQRSQRHESHMAHDLDRQQTDHVVQTALIEALQRVPRPFPGRFFPWLKATLSYRALEYVQGEIRDRGPAFDDDAGIEAVIDGVLANGAAREARFTSAGSSGFQEWLRTFDLASLFDLAHEFAPYGVARTACQQAVHRLPKKQRSVIERKYFDEMTSAAIAAADGLASSTVRNTHKQALRNLRNDDNLFEVLRVAGKVRDRARQLQLESDRRQAA